MEMTDIKKISEIMPSPLSSLSDKIDSACAGMDMRNHTFLLSDELSGFASQMNTVNNQPWRRLMTPMRVYSFDSALKMKERLLKSLSPSFHLSAVRSFHSSGDCRSVVWDPVSSSMRVYSQNSPNKSGKLRLLLSSSPSYISSAGHMAGGAELLVPQMGHNNWVVAVYDDEPTSIISYALSSKEHDDWISNP